MAKMSGIGGQAVIEGVMMKNGSSYSVSIRRPDGEIETKVEPCKSEKDRPALLRLPFIRGIVALVDSLVLGTKVLTYSAGFYEDEEEQPSGFERMLQKLFGAKAEKVLMACTVVFSVVMAIAIFMLLPYFVSMLLSRVIPNDTVLILLEGLIRILIFLLYVVIISQMNDIRRVFAYHGAEHKCINCVENGFDLTVPNVRRQSRLHRRCGTSFLFYVVFISIIVFMFVRVPSPVLRIVCRVLLVPVIAGISYEFIRLAGRTNFFLVRMFSWPGLMLQKLTTREPDDSMIEVGIASVEAVFDWRKFQQENFRRRGRNQPSPEQQAGLEMQQPTQERQLQQQSQQAAQQRQPQQPAQQRQSQPGQPPQQPAQQRPQQQYQQSVQQKQPQQRQSQLGQQPQPGQKGPQRQYQQTRPPQGRVGNQQGAPQSQYSSQRRIDSAPQTVGRQPDAGNRTQFRTDQGRKQSQPIPPSLQDDFDDDFDDDLASILNEYSDRT